MTPNPLPRVEDAGKCLLPNAYILKKMNEARQVDTEMALNSSKNGPLF